MFKPSEVQSRAKVRFHSAIGTNPLIGDPQKLTKARIAKLAEVASLPTWYEKDGFEEWFFNRDSNKELIESGVEQGIQAAIAIINRPVDGEPGSPRAADHLNALKLLADLGGYGAKHNKGDDKANSIDNLTEEELDRKIKELQGATPATITGVN